MGNGSHGARPEEGIDPVLTACHITTQSIVSRQDTLTTSFRKAL
jgi:metal-dependent amidase/aminoacylase/carboxypeptidase family protein